MSTNVSMEPSAAPWRWRQQASKKHQYLSAKLHSAAYQKTVILIHLKSHKDWLLKNLVSAVVLALRRMWREGYVKYEWPGRSQLWLVKELRWWSHGVNGLQKRVWFEVLTAVATERSMRQKVPQKCWYLRAETTTQYTAQNSSISKPVRRADTQPMLETGLPNTCLFNDARSSSGNRA
jgi:hypothetical protein